MRQVVCDCHSDVWKRLLTPAISVDQLTAKFETWQLYTQLLEYIRQGKNRIRLVASCRWALKFCVKTSAQLPLIDDRHTVFTCLNVCFKSNGSKTGSNSSPTFSRRTGVPNWKNYEFWLWVHTFYDSKSISRLWRAKSMNNFWNIKFSKRALHFLNEGKRMNHTCIQFSRVLT